MTVADIFILDNLIGEVSMQQGHNFIVKIICMLKPSSNQYEKIFTNLVNILHIGRKIYISLFANVIH